MIVDLMPTEDQAAIADTVAGFITNKLPLDRLRQNENRAGAAEDACWSQLADLGIFGLGLDEAGGGLGFTIAEETIVAQIMGRSLISPSVIATMLAAHIGPAGDFVAGSKRAAFAMPVDRGKNDGISAQIFDFERADTYVLCDNGAVTLCEANASKMVKSIALIDETLSSAEVMLRPAEPGAKNIGARADLLIAAYLSGIAAAGLDMAVDYAKVREQFGQPIGAFQAIKHYCADMALRAENAFAQTCYVAACAGAGEPDRVGTACAKLLAGDAALSNGRINIQIHGGMGFTDEADAHLLLKRAHVMAVLNGDKRCQQIKILE